MRLLRLIRPFEDFRARDGDSFNISAVKFAMSMCGCEFGPPRPPQRRLSAEQQQELASLVAMLLAAEQQVARTGEWHA
jgi:4-hydroxy-tetrahydrodipicolinate synthase